MTNEIKHRGIVESIDGSHISVRIIQASACSSCSAKGHCGSADNKEKLIDIYNVNSGSYKKGEEVIVSGTTSMGMQAVVIAFVVPFIILITVLFIAISATGGNEPRAALIALLSLIPYYIIVYLFRNKIKKKFTFTIKPII